MWALRRPNGKLIDSTAAPTRSDASAEAYDWLRDMEPQIGSFVAWDQFAEVMKRARRLGYSVVRCKLVEVTK